MLAPVPLHEPTAVFDVLTVLAAGESLPASGLAVLYDVPDDRTPAYVLIPDAPPDPPQHDRVRALSGLLGSIVTTRGATSAVLVVVRGGSRARRGDDYAWHDAFHEAGASAGLSPVGVYVLAAGVLTAVHGRDDIARAG